MPNPPPPLPFFSSQSCRRPCPSSPPKIAAAPVFVFVPSQIRRSPWPSYLGGRDVPPGGPGWRRPDSTRRRHRESPWRRHREGPQWWLGEGSRRRRQRHLSSGGLRYSAGCSFSGRTSPTLARICSFTDAAPKLAWICSFYGAAPKFFPTWKPVLKSMVNMLFVSCEM